MVGIIPLLLVKITYSTKRLPEPVSSLTQKSYNWNMNFLAALVLGVVQGLAEFLPISSSGHLVLAQSLIPGFSQPGVVFDVILHFGTLLSVLVFFRKKLHIFLNIRFIGLLVVATLPVALIGLLFKDQVEGMFTSVRVVGFALLITGTMNLWVDRLETKKTGLNSRNAFITGIFQAIAIIPGISRSGSTIFASAVQGISKREAAEFSFILSVPAVLGANILEIIANSQQVSGSYFPYFVGFLSAFITGILAIKLVFKVISGKHFEYFAYYCFIVGFLTILFAR